MPAQPNNKQKSYDLFARDLINQVRTQADGRINRNVRQATLGVCVSKNPLQIQISKEVLRPMILEADEVAVLPTLPIEQGQTVMLIRTVEDLVLALPLIPGTDVAEAPTFTGTDNSGGTDPNNTSVQSEPSVSGPAGERVIAKALSYLDVKETQTNGGGRDNKITEWIGRWGMSPGPQSPWCGCFADAMFHEAGVNDQGIGDPGTSAIYSKAKALDRVLDRPVKGCMAVRTPGASGHVTLYIDGPLENANCVGGNQSDAVTQRRYDIRGWYYCVPQALTQGATSTNSPSNSSSGSASSRPTTAPPDGDVS